VSQELSARHRVFVCNNDRFLIPEAWGWLSSAPMKGEASATKLASPTPTNMRQTTRSENAATEACLNH